MFQVLDETLGVAPEVWRVLAACHEKRNVAEYEGELQVSIALVDELIASCKILLNRLRA